MSNKLIKEENGRIIKPMGRPILTFVVDEHMQANLQAPGMHPREAAKALMNMAIDLMFSYPEAIVDSLRKDLVFKGEAQIKSVD